MCFMSNVEAKFSSKGEGRDTWRLTGPCAFNKILISGRYPTLWIQGLIIPIFKKDDLSNPQN